jgi:c-di-GMP-related signal transduction protein
MAAIEVVVARQSIFARDRSVYGYELLFRPVDGNAASRSHLDGDLMTSTVLFSSVTIGVERLVGGRYAFVNADRGLLTGQFPIMLPPEGTVLEVLETVIPDDEVIQGCRRLAAMGYRLALDDFTWFDGAEQLLELADIVKIDLRLVPPDELPALVARCRTFEVELLAEKIETDAELSLCHDLGFDYFQGFVLSRPHSVPGRTLGVSTVGRLQVAATLMAQEFDVVQLERVIHTEPGMTYQLLQLAAVGSRHGTRRQIRTVQQALVLLGSRRIQSWVALLMLLEPGTTSSDDVATALTRARMTELLAEELLPEQTILAFTAGLLSALDVLLGLRMDDILQELPLDDELRAAAFGESTPLGKLVRDVIDYLAEPIGRPTRSGVSEQDLDLASIRSLNWVLEAVEGLAEV